MREQIKKFSQLLKGEIKLSAEEKRGIQMRLLEVVRRLPVSSSQLVRQQKQRSPFISFNFLSFKFMPIAILLIVLLGGGVSFAAEGALPGDLLYPIKVGVNEQVRGALAVGAEADAEWKIKQVERRLEEAEELAAEGEFNAESRTEIEERFEAHITELGARLQEIHAEARPEVAARISANLEEVLEVHTQALAGTRGQAVSAVARSENADDEADDADDADDADESDDEVRAFSNTLMKTRERVRVRARGLELEIRAETETETEVEAEEPVSVEIDSSGTSDYWTEERRRNAIPMQIILPVQPVQRWQGDETDESSDGARTFYTGYVKIEPISLSDLKTKLEEQGCHMDSYKGETTNRCRYRETNVSYENKNGIVIYPRGMGWGPNSFSLTEDKLWDTKDIPGPPNPDKFKEAVRQDVSAVGNIVQIKEDSWKITETRYPWTVVY